MHTSARHSICLRLIDRRWEGDPQARMDPQGRRRRTLQVPLFHPVEILLPLQGLHLHAGALAPRTAPFLCPCPPHTR